jgi:hypothetical protein
MCRLFRPRHSWRRHDTGAHFPHNHFPGLCVGSNIREVQVIQRDWHAAALRHLLVVASEAVLFQNRACVNLGLLCSKQSGVDESGEGRSRQECCQ